MNQSNKNIVGISLCKKDITKIKSMLYGMDVLEMDIKTLQQHIQWLVDHLNDLLYLMLHNRNAYQAKNSLQYMQIVEDLIQLSNDSIFMQLFYECTYSSILIDKMRQFDV